ncbi:MAG: mechanosensitive ion channel domain-containing protein [Coleofasciculaceae cyanobacterium]
MASPKQAPATAYPFAFLATRRFWRSHRFAFQPKLTKLERSSWRIRRRWAILLLGLLTLLLTFMPVHGLAQPALVNDTNKAPVMIDGEKLFEVGAFGNFSAAERADLINEALQEEVGSPYAVKIEVVREDQQIIIHSRSDGGGEPNHLVTVTKADVISAPSILPQAVSWQKKIEAALDKAKLERTPAYYNKALLFCLVVLLVAIALQVGFLFLGKWVFGLLKQQLGSYNEILYSWEKPTRFLLRLALLGLQLGLWSAVGFYLTDVFPQTRNWRYQLFEFLNSPVIKLGESHYSAVELLLLIVLTVGLWLAVSTFTRFFKSYVLSKTGADTGTQQVIATLTHYLLVFLGLIVLLQSSGLDLSAFAIFASVLGVGIGFGVQNIANNLISGLIITLERPIKEGDFVKVGELLGIVKSIGARSTIIQTLDQVAIIVPNSRFLENEVINWSYGDPVSRLRIPVGVAYGSNVEQVKRALLEAARSHPEVLNRPKPQVWFQEFGESSLNFDLLVWTGVPKKQFMVKSDLNYRIEACLRRYGIEVPFPQRDLNIRSPQLDQFMSVWMQKNAPNHSQAAALDYSNGNSLTNSSSETTAITPLEQFSGKSITTAIFEEGLSSFDIEALITAMRGSGGVEIKDRRYRLNLYPDCFVGAEAVEWMMQTQSCTREEAIELGQIFMEREIIHHVTDEHGFKDEYLFYRFYCDEQ